MNIATRLKALAGTILIGVLMYYLFLPAANIHSDGLWWFLVVLGVVYCGCYFIFMYMSDGEYDNSITAALVFSAATMIILIITSITGSRMFNARRYSDIMDDFITTEDWNTIEDVSSVENIALIDTDTARVFGERTLGGLSDIVSQYEMSNAFTQINYQGKPMKVSLLRYGGFFKWKNNKENGIPGYILVDPVKNEGQYVKLKEGVKYSPSECFGRDLHRYLRNRYPSDLFSYAYFEIDEEGYPYYIAPVYKTTIGLFGGKVITHVIILDAITGDCEKIKVEDAPEWIDVIYDGDYLTDYIDDYCLYKNGFWNTIFGSKDCKSVTKIPTGDDGDNSYDTDYGYIADGKDIWIYTGITSTSSDSSNIAVVMANERTGETKYFEVSGADEYSAMMAAEGEVQQYKYKASFPSLISVNGMPTYIMVLCDANKIVKKFAMVNMENYSKVAVADTQEEVFALYVQKMGIASQYDIEDIAEDVNDTENTKETPEDASQSTEEPEQEIEYANTTIKVKQVQFIVTDGNTIVYVTDGNDKIWKTAFDEFFLSVKEMDEIPISYDKAKAGDNIIEFKLNQ